MSYDSQIAALSPWGYWKTNEASGNLADSSGNGRTMVVTGSPTYAQTGPGGGADAISWTNVASQHAETTATTNAGAFTYVVWVYLTSAPAANLALMSRAIAYNTVGAADGRLFIDTAGKVNFSVFAGSTITIAASTALPTNTWVMVTASVGAGGMRLRQNKTSMATNAANTAYTGASQLIFLRGGDSGYTGTAPVVESHASYFTSQLSNTDTDALVDAMTVLDATVTSPAATSTASASVPVLSAASSVAAVAAAASASALAPTVNGTGDATVLPPAAAATATAAAPVLSAGSGVTTPAASASASAVAPTVAASASATVTAPTASASAAAVAPAVSNGSPNATVEAPAASATASAVAPGIGIGLDTDLSNVFNGRERNGFATAEVDVPVDSAPTTQPVRVDKAIALPEPVLVKGRPT